MYENFTHPSQKKFDRRKKICYNTLINYFIKDANHV